MRKLGLGVVGCGNISGVYMPNMPLFAGVELRACADVKPEMAKVRAEQHNIPAMPVDALLQRDDIDIVVNLTVPNSHFDISMAALSAGKHVFSEKPLGVTPDEGRKLVREAASRKLLFGCAPDTFLGAGGRLAREFVDSGAIGRVVAGSIFMMSRGAEHWHPDPEFFYKPGGGPVLDIGPYYIAALVNLLGPVTRVQGKSSTAFAERLVSSEGPKKGSRITVETPTTLMAILATAAGADIVFTMSWDVWVHGHPPIEFYGAEGSLRVPDPNFYDGVVEITERGGDWRKHDSASRHFGKANWRAPMWPPSRPDRANYRTLGIAEMASAILKGTPHRSTAALAAHALDVMDAILEAGATGKVVDIASTVERPAGLSEADAGLLWSSPR
jgi:predicted dehydrogenase